MVISKLIERMKKTRDSKNSSRNDYFITCQVFRNILPNFWI